MSVGLKILEDRILEEIKLLNKQNINFSSAEHYIKDTYRLAIVGRPNSGKSTLFNSIMGKKRVLTGSKPGTTRDSVTDNILWKNNNIHLIDTAGMRKGSKINDKIEEKSVNSALNSIRYAQVVILVIDITMDLSKQDLSIASHVIQEGRVILIAAVSDDPV